MENKSHVWNHQPVLKCKIGNFPLFWPSGRKRHLAGVHIVQRLANLFRMRLLPVNFNKGRPQNSDVFLVDLDGLIPC